ncbi:protein FAR1-RELATED SEQUENCE 7-like [Bidens hawaiensis]|uniref:protein FAR1-RELATED SEQUENCE 7-like n=1 Tax=Bidens hawaiensis TaxID=980011 RepID=UPI00404AF17B
MVIAMLLKSFGHAPKVVVTNQDPAMKQAIAVVFPYKVGADLCNNGDFKSRLCNIVWNDSIGPLEFEEKWQAIMVEFELDKNKWLTDMYEIRFDWIPAFYKDELLSGLMLEFFNHFDFCMEIQRYNGRRCDHDRRYTYPQLETRSYLEREAVRIYTRAIFNDLQDEMNEFFGGVSQFSSYEEEEEEEEGGF